MTTDLSKVKLSATSIYIELLPTLESLCTAPISEEDRKNTMINTIVKALCKARSTSLENSYKPSISQDYITKTRVTLSNLNNTDSIIRYINNAINSGKNYKEGEN